jgi:pantoate--beta-alanine ligase
MNIFRSAAEMQAWANEARLSGNTISLVPTMGFLHEGHVALMREGKKRGDVLVISVFVNPAQFGAGEDYESYPRDLEGDAEKAAEAGADIIFAPSAKEMYPSDFQTYVDVENVTQNLCGLSRPTHFRGVTTVVTKLFNIIKPHVAVFGEKDFQQLITIRQMVKDLNMDIEVVGMPIVREEDGLAMSSRNKHLTPEEREAALCLVASLDRAAELHQGGERRSARILDEALKVINEQPLATIDYVKICSAETLEDIDTLDGIGLMALAVRIGTTRLIDNRILKTF